jgi:activator of 2-hydroxyglutaryl-CoA dehydratase
VSHLSEGVPLEDIVAGLHDAMASRIVRMVKRLKIEPDVVLTGGVAKNLGIVRAMEENLGREVLIPEDPLLSGAIGAAILGKELTLKALEAGPIPERKRRLEKVTFFSNRNNVI